MTKNSSKTFRCVNSTKTWSRRMCARKGGKVWVEFSKEKAWSKPEEDLLPGVYRSRGRGRGGRRIPPPPSLNSGGGERAEVPPPPSPGAASGFQNPLLLAIAAPPPHCLRPKPAGPISPKLAHSIGRRDELKKKHQNSR